MGWGHFSVDLGNRVLPVWGVLFGRVGPRDTYLSEVPWAMRCCFQGSLLGMSHLLQEQPEDPGERIAVNRQQLPTDSG